MRIDEFEDIMGVEAFVDLLKHFGGKRMYVPKNPFSNHPMTLAAGWTAAQALSSALGGEYVDLPTMAKYNRLEMRRKIILLRKQGLTIDAIAGKCGCGRRHVEKVCAEGREEIEATRQEFRDRQMQFQFRFKRGTYEERNKKADGIHIRGVDSASAGNRNDNLDGARLP